MPSSFAVYACGMLALLGFVELIHPIRRLGIRNRWVALSVLAFGSGAMWCVLQAAALAAYLTTPKTKLDAFAPTYPFSEAASIPVHAPARRVYQSVCEVTAA